MSEQRGCEGLTDSEKDYLQEFDLENTALALDSHFEMALSIAATDFADWLKHEIEAPIDFPTYLTRWISRDFPEDDGLLVIASWYDYWLFYFAELTEEEIESIQSKYPDYVFKIQSVGAASVIFQGECRCMKYEKPGDGRYWNIAAKAHKLWGRTATSISICPEPSRAYLDGEVTAEVFGVNPVSLTSYLVKSGEESSDECSISMTEEGTPGAVPTKIGPTQQTTERAHLFQSILRESPGYTKRQVARAAAESVYQKHGGQRPNWTQATVDNAFRAMGWSWKALKEDAARNT